MLGYGFIGRAHANGYRTLGYMAWPPPLALVSITSDEQGIGARRAADSGSSVTSPTGASSSAPRCAYRTTAGPTTCMPSRPWPRRGRARHLREPLGRTRSPRYWRRRGRGGRAHVRVRLPLRPPSGSPTAAGSRRARRSTTSAAAISRSGRHDRVAWRISPTTSSARSRRSQGSCRRSCRAARSTTPSRRRSHSTMAPSGRRRGSRPVARTRSPGRSTAPRARSPSSSSASTSSRSARGRAASGRCS